MAAQRCKRARIPFGWLGIGAIAAGVGAAVVTGQGIAGASTGDSDSGGQQASGQQSSTAPGKGLGGSKVTRTRAETPRASSTSAGAPVSTVSTATVSSASTVSRPSNGVLPRIRTLSPQAESLLASRRPNTQAAVTDTLTTDTHAVVATTTGVGATPDPEALAALLARPGVAITKNTDGSIRFIDGAFTDRSIASSDDAAAALNDLAAALGITSGFATADNIKIQRIGTTSADASAETFYRLQSRVNGVPVVGGDVILVTNSAGAVTGLFNYRGDKVDSVNTTADARIDDPSEAIAAALAAYTQSTSGKLPTRATQALLKSAVGTPELVIYSPDPATPPRLAWQVVVTPPRRVGATADADPGTTYVIYANGADAGTVARQTSNAGGAAPMSTTIVDRLNRPRDINISTGKFLIFDLFSLNDQTRNISTYQTTYSFFGFGPASLPGDLVYKSLFGWDPAAISAQVNMAAAYDYYSQVFGLNSFDGNGAPIKISVNYNPRSTLTEIFFGYANAFWDPVNQQFAYGTVNNFDAALDIAAHEYTHAVLSYIVGNGGSVLDYGEPGALNEAYADILGSLVEGKSGVGKWMFGEDTGSALRNLANPSAVNTEYGRYSTNYATRYTGTEDDGGEHLNSTIFSNAAYRMMTDSATAGISDETWSTMFYHSMYRLSTTSTFADGRSAVLDAASEMGFTAPELDAIVRAFNAVGITSS